MIARGQRASGGQQLQIPRCHNSAFATVSTPINYIGCGVCSHQSQTITTKPPSSSDGDKPTYHRPAANRTAVARWRSYFWVATDLDNREKRKNNWRAPRKNRICSTTRKLRKSLAKPVTRQKTFNNCVRNSRTTRYNCSFSATSLAIIGLRVIFSGRKTEQHVIITCCSVLPPEIVMHDAYVGVRSENNIWRAGCSRLEYVDVSLSIIIE